MTTARSRVTLTSGQLGLGGEALACHSTLFMSGSKSRHSEPFTALNFYNKPRGTTGDLTLQKEETCLQMNQREKQGHGGGVMSNQTQLKYTCLQNLSIVHSLLGDHFSVITKSRNT